MGVMNIILDPSEVAIEGRTELPLEGGGLSIYYEGLDFGDQEIKTYMAEGVFGSRPIDHDWPLRTIKIPLVVRSYGKETFDDIRVKLEAWTSAVANDGGGWLKRILPSGRHIFADIVEAKLHLTASWLAENQSIDREATLELQALPDFYGDEKTGNVIEGTGDAAWTEQVDGELPGRVTSLTAEDKSGNNQLGLAWQFRRKNYSASEATAWAYEAEDFLPLDLAEIASLSGASPSGSSSNNAIKHTNLSTNWTAILSTNRPPKVRAVAAAKASSGAITPALPEFKENDILVMFIETENQAVTPPAGWAHVSGSPIEVASGTLTRLTVLWKRAVANETAPTVEDPGDHIIGRIMSISGCIKTGNPWDVKTTGTELVSDTSVEIPGASTTVDGCLVIAAVATGTDVSSSAHISGWANSSLQALTERMDSWTTEGGGGGFGVATGLKASAGAYGATTATVGTANFKALMSFALKPETGGTALGHAGVYDVWARAYTSSEKHPWIRLLYDVGDMVAPSENAQVQIPGRENFYLVHLGQITLPRIGSGSQRWQGVIQARGESGGELVAIDRLWFFNADEGSGILKAQITPAVGLTGYKVRDEFAGAKAVLNERSVPDGSGKWASSGGAGDFETNGAGRLMREKKEVGEARIATPPKGPYTTVAAKVDIEWAGKPEEKGIGSLGGSLFTGFELFGTSVGLYRYGEGSGVAGKATSEIDYLDVFGRLFPFSISAGTTYTLTILALGGRYGALWVAVNGVATGAPYVFPIAAPEGKVLLYDGYVGYSTAVTRYYDNLLIWTPSVDAVIYANRDCRLKSSGVERASVDGSAYGPVTYPGSDLPRIPVSGPGNAPVEIGVKTSRGEFGEAPDSGLDKVAYQLAYRPCWPSIPSS